MTLVKSRMNVFFVYKGNIIVIHRYSVDLPTTKNTFILDLTKVIGITRSG
jgi:hypothetical protein